MSAQPKHGNNYDLIDTLISAAKGWPSNSWRIRVKWGGKTTFPVDQGEDGRASILNHHSVLYNGSNHCTWAKSKSLFPIFFFVCFCSSETNVCPTLKPAEQKEADSRVDTVKRKVCVKRKGRKRHSRRRFRRWVGLQSWVPRHLVF